MATTKLISEMLVEFSVLAVFLVAAGCNEFEPAGESKSLVDAAGSGDPAIPSGQPDVDPEDLATTAATTDTKLIEAATAGKIADVTKYLNEGADIHADDDEALKKAVNEGHTDTVRLLLERGANIHADDDMALQIAALDGHTAIVELLLDRGADIHAENDRALEYAVLNSRTDTIVLLLDRGADIHADGDRPLRTAVGRLHPKVYTDTVRLLLDRGADIDGALRYYEVKGGAGTIGSAAIIAREALIILRAERAREKKTIEALSRAISERNERNADLYATHYDVEATGGGVTSISRNAYMTPKDLMANYEKVRTNGKKFIILYGTGDRKGASVFLTPDPALAEVQQLRDARNSNIYRLVDFNRKLADPSLTITPIGEVTLEGFEKEDGVVMQTVIRTMFHDRKPVRRSFAVSRFKGNPVFPPPSYGTKMEGARVKQILKDAEGSTNNAILRTNISEYTHRNATGIEGGILDRLTNDEIMEELEKIQRELEEIEKLERRIEELRKRRQNEADPRSR